MSVYFHPAVRLDISRIEKIEFDSFESCPRVKEEIDYWFRIENVRVIGAYINGLIVAYAVYSSHPDSLHLERIAVAPGLRRTGIGRGLVGVVSQQCTPIQSFIDCYVPVDDIGACKFLNKCGFLAIQDCEGVLEGPCKDAYRFEMRVYK